MKTLKFNKFDNVIPLNLALADFDGLAKEADGVVLQLPFEEEDADV